MANVKIHVHGCDLAQSTSRIERGLDILSYLIHAKLYSDSKSDYLERFNLQQGYLLKFMQDRPLSDWLELYICKTMLSVSGELQRPQREFFDAVSCIYTQALRQSILKQINQSAEHLHGLKRIDLTSISITFFSVSQEVERTDKALDPVSLMFSEHEEEVQENTLSLALMIAKIALFVEEYSILESKSLKQCLESMKKDPFRSIAELSKILIDFVALHPSDEEQMIHAKLDQAILSTLKFLGLKEKKPEAVLQIRDTLLKNGVMTLVKKESELVMNESETDGPSIL